MCGQTENGTAIIFIGEVAADHGRTAVAVERESTAITKTVAVIRVSDAGKKSINIGSIGIEAAAEIGTMADEIARGTEGTAPEIGNDIKTFGIFALAKFLSSAMQKARLRGIC